MKPTSTPGVPPSGELSYTISTGPWSPTARPESPSWRQNGSSYSAWTLTTLPIGTRWVSWLRQPGSGGR
jgi:hypothetical protein